LGKLNNHICGNGIWAFEVITASYPVHQPDPSLFLSYFTNKLEMLLSTHTVEDCGSVRCPRCAAVYSMLERLKIPGEFTQGTKIFHLAEHTVELEEALIEYKLRHIGGYHD
jgi:hypothetical protein